MSHDHDHEDGAHLGDVTNQLNHDHTFGQDQRRPGEQRTLIVVGITLVMMVIEITAGKIYGSMALLADGLHMASHAAAMTVSVFAYRYARKHAANPIFSFGTGKVNALGGFTGALLLLIFALAMVGESLERLLNPVEIGFNQAMLVAVIGLIVNAVSAVILGGGHHHDHDHDHDHGSDHHHDGEQADHNLRAAYLHVIADALTSILAIAALFAGKHFGAVWMDPAIGILGAVLITRWSIGLLKGTSAVLLDRQGPETLRESVRKAIEHNGDDRVTDLHLWSVGPQIYAVLLVIVSKDPKPPAAYRKALPSDVGLVHVTVEIHPEKQTIQGDPADE